MFQPEDEDFFLPDEDEDLNLETLDAFEQVLKEEIKTTSSSVDEEALLTKDSESRLLIKKLELQNRDLKQDIAFRRLWTPRLYRLTKCWLYFVGVLVIWQGFHQSFIPPISDLRSGWHLSDGIMIAILGTTTVTVVGLFGTVITYFFKKQSK